ncbi:MAG: tetratricopeptide repeat protein [Acutalibacteraceae bacterium]
MGQEERINITRFIDRLDACFNRNDMRAARECIEYWENEARQNNDDRGLLTVLNEAVGYYRRSKKKTKALKAMEESLSLVEKLGLSDSLSGATIYINAATTLSFFGRVQEGLELYEKAEACYQVNGGTQTYEYAALLNNKAATLNELKRYDEAETNWKNAIEILKKVGYHDGEIAISLVMLAHLTFDRDDTAYEQVEALLDEAWDYINSDNQPKDGNYAYVLRKCAPSFDYFQRPMEAQALRDVAKEIYERG